ncbi:toll/interleukin-1 receptor domain-containing protein [Proteus mirabilis]|uniref:toll/interleukin-1 receptor domain-containing protein n=2 Tax=Morganellaceae TaxID=1903414 RepID=UPI0002D2A227|nr:MULTISPECIES: toll/interleukin-1 receptor domain-containing protein [Proteus]MBA7797993.1 toll/interleukin-1 receptor domain-containing protein [Citrobacter sp. RHBSTW-01065]AND14843.1 hypothetical protein AOUC001_18960 [Proteus mirabilis]EHZ6747837.1 toll/interleukin-1 receptor domain-containing protein [Proteus mirabilis]EKT8250876.1 toll/interleukin-1 receptor domain-containing protein [Proteus mirabilis]EKU6774018.1 toll/interleukin-1 receptor domain-containing protein [Proteus mirabili
MNHVYQLVLLGDKEKYEKPIVNWLLIQTKILGIQNEFIKVINRLNFNEYLPNNPTYGLYFGSENTSLDQNILNTLIDDATLILPIIPDLSLANHYLPKELHPINAIAMKSINDIPTITSAILEGFELLRQSRKLFISYKRSESSTVAIQLYEVLEKFGFDVFLDTHSIRPGEPFQEELWHRMTDSDIVILLNTPDFLGSQWTQEELAKASAMSLGIIQIIWPDCTPLRESELFRTIKLQRESINNQGHLSEFIIKQLISETESLRARTLAARQDNLTTEFIDISHKLGVKSILHTDKFITFSINDRNYVVIPTVGVPQSFTSNNIYTLRQKICKDKIEEIYLLYDHTHIRKKWLAHLSWLDEYLPVKTLRLLNIQPFIENQEIKNG